jgi:ectoine hydroxylase-related dioxygenase (phytanoyl-CoA dioxygenase family)
MIAVSDFTEENGATRIVAGSNRWDHYPEIYVSASGETDDRYDTIAAEMPRGSVCFVLGSTYHGGDANRSNAPRHGMTMAFWAGWVPPQQNFTVAVSQERAATFEPELQALMGGRAGQDGGLGRIFTSDEHLSGPLAHRLISSESHFAAPVRQTVQPNA